MNLLKKYNRTSKKATVTLPEEIAFAILGDVTDRRGWRQEWDGFDSGIQNEILESWVDKIEQVLNSKIKQ